jgi:hypothetical protein
VLIVPELAGRRNGDVLNGDSEAMAQHVEMVVEVEDIFSRGL